MISERQSRRKEKAKRLGRKPSLSSLKKKFWKLLATSIRLNHPTKCFTCDSEEGTQTGHMLPKGRSHALSAWHPGNLRPQGFYCNINLGGNGAEFAIRYSKAYGQSELERMQRLSKTPHKWTPYELEIMIEKIKQGLDEYTKYYEETYCAGI